MNKCWFWHDWEKWREAAYKVRYRWSEKEGIETWLRRTCKRCGLVQRKEFY